MIHIVKQILRERENEIETYFSFLKIFLQEDNTDRELSKILRANLILMLYNLIESTISNAIECIHNSVHANNTSFDSLNVKFKKILIKNIKEYQNPHDFVTQINFLATDIVKKSFSKNRISNGNIDNETISKLADNYGFSKNTCYTKTKSGICLKSIRAKRNDLAHGTFSFVEVGKDYSFDDLKSMKDETINYINN